MNDAERKKQLADLKIGDRHFDKLLEKANTLGYQRGYAAAERRHRRQIAWTDVATRLPKAGNLYEEIEVLGQLSDRKDTVTLVRFWPAVEKWTALLPLPEDPDTYTEQEVQVLYWQPKPHALMDSPPECNCRSRSIRVDRHWIDCPYRQHEEILAKGTDHV